MSITANQTEPKYHSYLMRLWRAGKEKAWRVMLECVETHERHGFADLEGLCAFLREQMTEKKQDKGNENAQ